MHGAASAQEKFAKSADRHSQLAVLRYLNGDSACRAIETSYGFDLQGRSRAQLTFAPGDTDTSITTSYLYDSLGRLDTQTDTDGDGNVTASYDYEVRADGRRTGSTETFWVDSNEDGIQDAGELQTSTYDWSYDGLNRLTDEVIDHWDDNFDQTESYTYDATGNRTRVERLSQSSQESIEYRYDANDRLFAELTDDQTSNNADTTTIYGYDHTQQTEKTVYTDLLDEATIESLVSGGDDSAFQRVSAQTFVYNLQGRMSEAVVDKYNSDGTLDTREKSSYQYDMRSFRVGQTAETWNESTGEFEFKSDTEFLVSHRNHTGYAQTLRETTTNADGSIKTIDYTFGHDEVSQRVVERNDQGNVTSVQTLVFGHDGHGSVRVLYDLALSASNLIAQLVTYSSYGVKIAMHSGDGTVVDAALSSLGYSGEHFDSTIQKDFNRDRWYDPFTGQWNRKDDFTGNNHDPQSLHKNAYVHGDPINGIDPTGLSVESHNTGGFLLGVKAHLVFSAFAFHQDYSDFPGFPLWIVHSAFSGTAYEWKMPDLVDTNSRRYYELKPDRWVQNNNPVASGIYANIPRQHAFDIQMSGYDEAFQSILPSFSRGDVRRITGGSGWLPIGYLRQSGRWYRMDISSAPNRLSPSRVNGRRLIQYSLVRQDPPKRKPLPVPSNITAPSNVNVEDLYTFDIEELVGLRPNPGIDYGFLVQTAFVTAIATAGIYAAVAAAPAVGTALVSGMTSAMGLKLDAYREVLHDCA